MTKMVSLAQKYDSPSSVCCDSADEYFPSAYLDKKQIDALELGRVRVGDEMTMLATVRLSSLSESKDGHRNMTLEIVEATIKPKAEKTDAASVLYPEG